MAIAQKIETYSVWVGQTSFLGYDRVIRLLLDDGSTAYIGFPQTRPADWLQFTPAGTNLFLTQDEFDGVYHLLQSEEPVFFTAIDLLGLQVGAVHTELDLTQGERPGDEEDDDEDELPQSIEALIRLARRQGDAAATGA